MNKHFRNIFVFFATFLFLFLVIGITSFVYADGKVELIGPIACWVNEDDPDTEHCRWAIAEGASAISFKISNLSAGGCYYIQGVSTVTDNPVIGDEFWDGENFVSQKNAALEDNQSDNDKLCGVGNTHFVADNKKENFLKANEDGVLIIESICDNMEGIRYDCEDEYLQPIQYKFKLFKVDLEEDTNDVESVDTVRVDRDHFTVQEQISPSLAIDPGEEVNTAFGKIIATPAAISTLLLRIAVGVAGGVAFLLMVFGSYRLIFSAGNPEAIQQGREVITAAIVGLIIIVFSVFILRLIGISILGLPL